MNSDILYYINNNWSERRQCLIKPISKLIIQMKNVDYIKTYLN